MFKVHGAAVAAGIVINWSFPWPSSVVRVFSAIGCCVRQVVAAAAALDLL